jgi:NTE family protein
LIEEGKMKSADYISDKEIQKIINDLHDQHIPEKHFSDVIDSAKRQYVDLVMEGGGVLGVALAGYVHVLEQMNIRFLKLGGTSAGAINTMLMAAAGPIEQSKTEWILEKIAEKNFNDFVDGGHDARRFIDAIADDQSNFVLAVRSLQVLDEFKNNLGLCPGNAFYQWMRDVLAEKGIKTLYDLFEIRKVEPAGGLYNRYAQSKKYTNEDFERIVIIASDITTQSKIIFPEMALLYWEEFMELSPAHFVRASMSIPFFFFPYRVKNIPEYKGSHTNWAALTGFRGPIPKEVAFVDGGIMSNFPIDIFHEHGRVPHAPTFGVKLGYDRIKAQRTDKFFPYLSSVFDSARHIHDFDFLLRNPDYKHIICAIDTGDHSWLNFNISDEEKLDLFRRGAQAAANFLIGFDWMDYKKIRKELAMAWRNTKD